jgi:diguanylate cyclase (GGDEF)-like protein
MATGAKPTAAVPLRGTSPGWRPWTVPVIGLALAIAAIATTLTLQRQENNAHNAQLDLQAVKLELSKLQSAPFQAHASTGGNPELAAGLMTEGRQRIADSLEDLEASSRPAALDGLAPLLKANNAKLDGIYELGASGVGYQAEADRLAGESRAIQAEIVSMLDEANTVYDDRAAAAAARVTFGGIGVIVLLFGAFAFYYRRSVRTALANSRILARTRQESLTDSLTGLGNRRALINDLDTATNEAPAETQSMLALFDLDGFKQYNDTFGHPAGDSLLRRLGHQLDAAVGDVGSAYRMGGDEFCLLAPVGAHVADQLAELGAGALAERGKGFEIGCSYGVCLIPTDAPDTEGALRHADGRMYAQKAGRASAGRQSSDVLLRVLTERHASLGEHLSGVAALAEPTAVKLGLSEPDAKRIRTAAELHDVGKTGIPDAILEKPDPLDDDEMAFMRRHTLIGERILRAAPALAPAAGLVRSSHERMDGTGYPDGLEGESIPLGSRIIFVCDAFDAIISDRAYRAARSVPEALAELRRCAGTQFDPRVVEALCDLVEDGAALQARENSRVTVAGD